jgi:hypothetical protein
MKKDRTLLIYPPCLYPNKSCDCQSKDVLGNCTCRILEYCTAFNLKYQHLKELDELVDKLIFLHIHRKEQAQTIALLNIKHPSQVIQHVVRFILEMNYCRGPIMKISYRKHDFAFPFSWEKYYED